MKLTFDQSQYFSVPEKLLSILNTELAKLTEPQSDSLGITFNFRDPDYSADKGGFHPVEIRLNKHNNQWHFEYITDFSFQGFPYPELVKEIDICFHSKEVSTFYGVGMNKQESDEFIEHFLGNFINYVEMGVFTVRIGFD
jgi:hypothetical protein